MPAKQFPPCSCRVSFDELSAALGNTRVDLAVQAAGYHVTTDWRGRPSLTVDDAAAFVAGERESRERQRAADLQRQADEAAAEKRQRDAEREVYEAAVTEAQQEGKSAPAAHHAGIEALQRHREQPGALARLGRRLTGKDAA